jgi:hypothetical protein
VESTPWATETPRPGTGEDCTIEVVVWPNGVKRSISSSRCSTSRTCARMKKQSSPVIAVALDDLGRRAGELGDLRIWRGPGGCG